MIVDDENVHGTEVPSSLNRNAGGQITTTTLQPRRMQINMKGSFLEADNPFEKSDNTPELRHIN